MGRSVISKLIGRCEVGTNDSNDITLGDHLFEALDSSGSDTLFGL
jgi:hypothetical protein